MTSDSQPKRFLQSLNVSLDILEEIARADQPKGVTEIAGIVGLSKGAAHTILANLEARGYIRRATNSLAFTLGRKAWELGLKAGQSFDLGDLVHEELTRIMELTGETAQIVGYVSPGEVIFLHRVISRHAVQAAVPLGDRAPASTTSSGQILLAHQPEQEIERALQRPLPAVTPNSITDPAVLREVLARVRFQGYAINVGTHYLDTVTMSVPVYDHTGAVPYAVGIYGPEYRLSVAAAEGFVPAVAEIVSSISRKLGHRALRKAR